METNLSQLSYIMFYLFINIVSLCPLALSVYYTHLSFQYTFIMHFFNRHFSRKYIPWTHDNIIHTCHCHSSASSLTISLQAHTNKHAHIQIDNSFFLMYISHAGPFIHSLKQRVNAQSSIALGRKPSSTSGII